MGALVITDANFQKEILEESSRYCLVDFWAEWCGPCRMMAPILDNLSSKYSDKLKIGKLNTDENPRSAGQYEISSIPCCILFKDGQEVDRIIGLRAEAEMVNLLKAHVSL